jgi:anti-anti-sigma factor
MSDIATNSEPTLSPEEAERVDHVCDEFEDVWKKGERPDLKSYVKDLDSPVGKVLLRELLKVELAYRIERGEQPMAEEYQAIFLEHADLIAALFAKAMEQLSSSEGATTPPNSSAVDPELPPGPESPPDPKYIGRYKVIRKLGGGSYGDVYLAHDPVMDCEVAVKVPSTRLLATERAREELLREVRSAARLRHEGIVRAYHFPEESEGQCYIVYEYIEGTSLKERLKQGLPSLEEAASIVAQVAEALHYAHLQRLIHRDIKPANILLDRQGKPKVTDFGLAVREEELPQQRGLLAGTYAYMSPEQVRREGHLIDGRTDIYSLGVVLYELLCGQRPFRGQTEEELKEEILSREPKPPRQVNDFIPQWLERICLKALSKRIGDRYTTAKDMAEELRRTILPRGPSGYFRVEDRKEATILVVTSEELLDDKVIENFKAELYRFLVKSKTRTVILDFSKVEYVSSTYIGPLISAQQRLMDRGRKLCICGLTEGVFEFFDIARLTRFFEIKPDLASALDSSSTAPLTLEELERQMASADEAEIGRWLRIWSDTGTPESIPLVFRCLGHGTETVRKQARQAVQSFGWEKVSAAAEDLARRGDSPGTAAVLDGLAAFEAHPQIVGLLDRLVVPLKGDLRNRTILLLERKRLSLELDAVAGLFRDIQSPYRIEKALGQGLFAASYLAHAEGADLAVVVRVLRPEFVGQPHLRAQFLDLSKRSLQLVHENLVLTREARAFPERHVYFAVRDYVNGVTLQKALEGGKRFEPPHIVRVLRLLLGALSAVHRRGMSHGSVKPSNIFVCERDQVVLGDPALPVGGIGVALPRLSYDYRYAAPETFSGGGVVGPQSDFYSLGCVAYELACGEPPFVSDNYLELAARHLHEAVVPPSHRGSRLGPDGDVFLLKLLARSTADRYAWDEHILGALDRLEDSWKPDRLEDSRESGLTESCLLPGPPHAPLLRDASLARLRTGESVLGFDVSAASLPPRPGDTLAGAAPQQQAPPPEQVELHERAEEERALQKLVTDQPRLHLAEEEPAVEQQATVHPKRLGNYEILGKLGMGGMGVVYKAVDRRLERVVALKVLPDAAREQARRFYFGDALDEQQSRFRVEALAAAKLQNPHIVQIYDIGEHQGLPYLALEYVGGGSLAEKLRQEGPIPRTAAETVAKLARAVNHAHEHGVLHRDLKPSNVLLTADGEPKIADFGLAKIQELTKKAANITASGMIIGTPAYMAPEQARGEVKTVGPTADIYSLGAILYELLTGRPPFQGESVMGTLSKIATEQVVPPHTLNPAVSPDLSAICLKCLEKDPQKRYDSALGLAEDLERWLKGGPIQARPASKISRFMSWCRGSLKHVLLIRKRA